MDFVFPANSIATVTVVKDATLVDFENKDVLFIYSSLVLNNSSMLK